MQSLIVQDFKTFEVIQCQTKILKAGKPNKPKRANVPHVPLKILTTIYNCFIVTTVTLVYIMTDLLCHQQATLQCLYATALGFQVYEVVDSMLYACSFHIAFHSFIKPQFSYSTILEGVLYSLVQFSDNTQPLAIWQFFKSLYVYVYYAKTPLV